MIVITPHSDITIHVEGPPGLRGTIVQDVDSPPATVSPTGSKHVAPVTERATTRHTWLRFSTSQSKMTTKLSTSRTIMANLSFNTIYASKSRVTSTTETPLSTSRTISTIQKSTRTYEWTSHASVQQSTGTQTPVVLVGGEHLSKGPITTPLLCMVIFLVAFLIGFTLKAYCIVNHGNHSFRGSYRTLRNYLNGGDGNTSKDEKKDSKDHKHKNISLLPVLSENGLGNCPSLQIRECRRINMRKANARPKSHVPPNITPSPPKSPRIVSFQGTGLQTTASSSVYSTPTLTPVETMFPSTLRRRSHIFPSLNIEPPSFTSPTTISLDLEGQGPVRTPILSRFRPQLSRSASRESSPTANEGKYHPPRIGNSGWVAGAVDRIAEGLVRYTRDSGSEEGLWLPLNKSSRTSRF
jgi:hypothetical protein